MKRVGRIILIGLGVVLVILLIGPFLVPVPPLEGTVPPQELADPDSLFIEIDDVTLHYKVQGDGEPVLLLMHGFAASLFSWQTVMPRLAEIGTVIAYDRPAFGLTERPLPGDWDGPSPYGTQSQITHAIGLMDVLGVKRAILVGNSAGGRLAMEVALQHPERVEALILVDPAVYSDGDSGRWLRPLLRTPQMRRLGPLITRRIQEWGLDFAESAWHNPDLITDEIWEGYLKPLQADNWDVGLWEMTIASEESDLVERLDEFNIPILVITGDDDRIVPTENSIRLAGELPDADLTVVEACGHAPHEECPQPFLDSTFAFLNKLGYSTD